MEITQRHEELERELAKQKEDAKKDSDALIARAEQLAKEGRLEQLKAEREKLQRKLDEEREALQQRLEQERAELRAKMEAEEATEVRRAAARFERTCHGRISAGIPPRDFDSSMWCLLHRMADTCSLGPVQRLRALLLHRTLPQPLWVEG